MSKPKYDAAYFIRFFTAINSRLFITEQYGTGKRHCAQGHTGQRNFYKTPKSIALARILLPLAPFEVNDGTSPKYQQPTIKARILAALRDAEKAGR